MAAEPPPVGSAAWTGGSEYVDEYADRIKDFWTSLNREALRLRASQCRNGQPCTVSSEFSVGQYNLVCKLRFDDGIEWVARLRMPPLQDGPAAPVVQPAKILRDMESELVSMRFIRQMTPIPVPEIFDYILSSDNEIGCPFILMEYIHGNTAEEVSQSYPGNHEGIPAQFEATFWEQLAEVMVHLASIRLPKIGSLIASNDLEGGDLQINAPGPGFIKVSVGRVAESNSGPYNSAAEFYDDYPNALNKPLSTPGGEDVVDGQEKLIQTFRALAASFPPTRSNLPGFGLVHFDLNPNNILVDREFNIVGVIDWDALAAVPDAALFRFPFLMGIDSPVPGVEATHPAVLRREQRARDFAAALEKVSRRMAQGQSDPDLFVFSQSGFYSREALAYRALIHVQMRQDWVNEEWINALEWLSLHEDDAEVCDFFLTGRNIETV